MRPVADLKPTLETDALPIMSGVSREVVSDRAEPVRRRPAELTKVAEVQADRGGRRGPTLARRVRGART